MAVTGVWEAIGSSQLQGRGVVLPALVGSRVRVAHPGLTGLFGGSQGSSRHAGGFTLAVFEPFLWDAGPRGF